MSVQKGIIVESPNKVPKIQGYLDKEFGVGVWKAASSVGHIRDLPEKELGIDRAAEYKRNYIINPDKKRVVSNLIALADEVGRENIYLATDPDREGEAIAFHLAMALKLSVDTAKRVTFNEITQPAIAKAIRSARTIDKALVRAQEARRVVDRLSGYEVTAMMSRKIGEWLSAGRVQSPALRLCVDRERQIKKFTDSYVFRLRGIFLTPKSETLIAQYHKPFTTKADVMGYLAGLADKKWTVESVEVKPIERQPKPAFTTSSLQQEAIRKFGKSGGKWSAKKVMDLAQKLFEQGHITYMRTDSPNLSEEAVAAIKTLVTTKHGAGYFQARTFKAKDSAQEAHEAIRPTHFEDTVAGQGEDEQKLYKLIYARAVASQMKAALLEQTVVIIRSQVADDRFVAKASVMKFEGYLVVYTEEPDEAEPDEETTIKAIASGDKLNLEQLKAKQTYAQPAKRFDEASLVAELEKRGIGRPSTYATILSGIIHKEYVAAGSEQARKVNCQVFTWAGGKVTESGEVQSVGGDKNKLFPTETGHKIINFLESHFATLVDYTFTADMEGNLDQITEGKNTFLRVVTAFDQEHTRMLQTVNTALKDVERKVTSVLIGDIDGLPVKAGISKKGGVYVFYNEVFCPVEGQNDFKAVTLDMAKIAIAAKKAKEAQREKETLRTIEGKTNTYSIRQGQYGIYVTNGTDSAGLRDVKTQAQVDALTASECKVAIDSYKEWKKKNPAGSGAKKGAIKGGKVGAKRN